MKDITEILAMLDENNITKTEYAKYLGVKRQNIQSWKTTPNGIPKAFLDKTAEFIMKKIDKRAKIRTLSSYLQDNSNKSKKLLQDHKGNTHG